MLHSAVWLIAVLMVFTSTALKVTGIDSCPVTLARRTEKSGTFHGCCTESCFHVWCTFSISWGECFILVLTTSWSEPVLRACFLLSVLAVCGGKQTFKCVMHCLWCIQMHLFMHMPLLFCLHIITPLNK